MKHLAVTLGVAVIAFALILGAKHLVTHDEPGPWLTDEAEAFRRARAQRKAVLIDLTASWSMPSEHMSRSLDGLVRMIDRDFVRLRIDVSDGGDEVRARYGTTTIPAIVMVESDGRVRGRITRLLVTSELRAALQAR